MFGTSHRRITLALAFLLSLSVFASAGGVPSLAQVVHPCKGDGYLTVATADGVPFKNRGQCMRYVNSGGTLAPVPRIVLDFQAPFASWCEDFFSLHDFPASIPVHFVYGPVNTDTGEPGVREQNVTTDSAGYAKPGGGSVLPGITTVTGTWVTSSGPVTIVATFPCVPFGS
jgi:hypothetical protein